VGEGVVVVVASHSVEEVVCVVVVLSASHSVVVVLSDPIISQQLGPPSTVQSSLVEYSQYNELCRVVQQSSSRP